MARSSKKPSRGRPATKPSNVRSHRAEPGTADAEDASLETEPQSRAVPSAAVTRIDGVVVATLLALGADGRALVRVLDPAGLDPRLEQPIFATSAAALGRPDIGRRVALLFEQRDPGRPIIIGLMHEAPRLSEPGAPPPAAPVSVRLDAEELHLDAERELVLSCGKASITLTRAGKIILHGTYVVSRSTGLNRIKGGSVQIN